MPDKIKYLKRNICEEKEYHFSLDEIAISRARIVEKIIKIIYFIKKIKRLAIIKQ